MHRICSRLRFIFAIIAESRRKSRRVRNSEGRNIVKPNSIRAFGQRRRCSGIKTILQDRFSDPIANRWVFGATVYKSLVPRSFVGYGDADPTNASPLVRGAGMRVAETRAVSRILRKAYLVRSAGAHPRNHPNLTLLSCSLFSPIGPLLHF
jgi:hypothetical protein